MSTPLRSLPPGVLEDEMRAFRDGTRTGTVMPQIARGYTDAETHALAGWLARRAADTVVGQKTPAEQHAAPPQRAPASPAAR